MIFFIQLFFGIDTMLSGNWGNIAAYQLVEIDFAVVDYISVT